jgi:hypothetical protein
VSTCSRSRPRRPDLGSLPRFASAERIRVSRRRLKKGWGTDLAAAAAASGAERNSPSPATAPGHQGFAPCVGRRDSSSQRDTARSPRRRSGRSSSDCCAPCPVRLRRSAS